MKHPEHSTLQLLKFLQTSLKPTTTSIKKLSQPQYKVKTASNRHAKISFLVFCFLKTNLLEVSPLSLEAKDLLQTIPVCNFQRFKTSPTKGYHSPFQKD